MRNNLGVKILHIDKTNYTPIATVKQDDNITVVLELYKNNLAFDITGHTAKLSAMRSDKVRIEQTTDFLINKNSLTINIKNDISAKTGIVYFEVILEDDMGSMSTFNFCLKVNRKIENISKGVSGADGEDCDFSNYIINDVVTGGGDKALSAEQGKILSSQLKQKASYFTLKEFKKNHNTTGEALQECINYVCENRIISTDIEYEGVSVGGTVIDLCGCDVELDKTLNIAYGDIRYSDITFENGTLKASNNFTDKYLLMIGKYSHNRGLKFYNITFNCNMKCSPFYMERTLNTIFNGCTFTNLKAPAQVHYEQTHETIFDNCYFSNAAAVDKGINMVDFALELGVDSHVSNCNFIGFKNGINCLGGCNMISNNHFYYIEDYAIVTREGTVLNNIYGNYFDGCSLYIEKEYGDINIVSNVFLEPLYASGIHSKYLLKRTNISNNTYRFASDKRARLLGIEGIINGNILTVKKDLFNKYDIGAIDERGTLCITGFIDSKNVKVSYDATSIQTGVYSVYWLFPTNLIPLMTISDLALNSIATINENIIDGNIPNNAIKKCVINEELIDGEINVVVDRINDIKFLENCCWTISNLAEETHFKLGNLPEKLYPVQDMYVNVLVRNANDENDIYGTCIALISSLTGEIIIIKKSGDFNKNSVEYSLKTYYK